MALNWTMLNADRTPVPLPGEITIMTIHFGAELMLTIPDAPPAGASSAGGSGGSRKLKEEGKVFLTEQRFIFVANSPFPASGLNSLSVPLTSFVATKFEQPLLGSNYLAVDIRPSPEGGLTEGTHAELRSKTQPLFQFSSVLEKTRERAVYMRRQMQMEEQESLRSGRAGGGTPMEAPPGYND
ncbi:hypothetical protein K488DRAFT_69224 [Vararia minispora EC-137]|uniref:Uncharacterized protein n=1 Tax=Vararia minispora EC-137 TaxID=1314806 RepID=A0ACB8QRX8_9AGAM|nr:hypothetical protein K488DRAFT_69224 [Vararia minispora EC-137]